MTHRQLEIFLAIQHRLDKGLPFTYRWLAQEVGLANQGRAYEAVTELCSLGYLGRLDRKVYLQRRVSRIVEWRTYDPETELWSTFTRGREWTGEVQPAEEVA